MQKYQNQQQQQAWDKEWEDLTGNTSDVPSMYEHFGSYGNMRLRERPGALRRVGGSELEREAKEYKDAIRRKKENADRKAAKERQQQQQQQMDNAGGWSSTNRRNNASPAMQNPLPPELNNMHPIAMNREQLNQYRQNMWEEYSGSNSRMPQYGNLKNIGFAGTKDYDSMIKTDALAYKRKQQALSRQKFQESFDEEQWREAYKRKQQQQMDNSRGWTNPNLSNNASPQMRHTSLIPRGATNTPYNTQNTFKPMNPMAFLDNYNSSKSSGSMGPRAQMQNPFQF